MNMTKPILTACPDEVVLSDYLAGGISADRREALERHIAGCDECLSKLVSSYESVREFERTTHKRRFTMMKRTNWYAILAFIFFIASFGFPRYFIQFLVASVVLSLKWIVDAKNTRILISIYEAWKRGGEKETSRIFKEMDIKDKDRFLPL